MPLAGLGRTRRPTVCGVFPDEPQGCGRAPRDDRGRPDHAERADVGVAHVQLAEPVQTEPVVERPAQRRGDERPRGRDDGGDDGRRGRGEHQPGHGHGVGAERPGDQLGDGPRGQPQRRTEPGRDGTVSSGGGVFHASDRGPPPPRATWIRRTLDAQRPDHDAVLTGGRRPPFVTTAADVAARRGDGRLGGVRIVSRSAGPASRSRSRPFAALSTGHTLQPIRRTVRRPRRRSEKSVADLLYALLLVGVFAVLALCLRGLERL